MNFVIHFGAHAESRDNVIADYIVLENAILIFFLWQLDDFLSQFSIEIKNKKKTTKNWKTHDTESQLKYDRNVYQNKINIKIDE